MVNGLPSEAEGGRRVLQAAALSVMLQLPHTQGGHLRFAEKTKNHQRLEIVRKA